MAVSPSDEAKEYLQELVDENDSLHLSSSCFQTVKQGVDAVDQHYCLDVLPVVLEKSSFPMTLTCPYRSSHVTLVSRMVERCSSSNYLELKLFNRICHHQKRKETLKHFEILNHDSYDGDEIWGTYGVRHLDGFLGAVSLKGGFPSLAIAPCVPGQDVYNVSVVSDEGFTNPQCPTQLAFLSFLQVPQRTESPMCLVAHWNCKNCSTSEYSECTMDIDIENETLETPKNDDRTVGSSMKTESALTRAFSWKINLQIGGQIMQLLMNHIIMLLKCSSRDKSTTERTPDTPNNRLGRYKRSASFNSRKIALFFSILSSIGTMVLIYLTLRVKQINDALVHV
ncbi:hypothetical protein BVC80_9029g35 [Macleaya cordata]|uniref:Uncharacterized protein n=1 Tax=Macleaya cordata TaxID=56857 RepID=A0A200QUQ4_MACCD|nr:hypothetical protein BVC80_9029g35 [Macleaya cordata]